MKKIISILIIGIFLISGLTFPSSLGKGSIGILNSGNTSYVGANNPGNNNDRYPLMMPFSSNNYNMNITCDKPEKTVYSKKSAIYNIQIENTGDLIDTYNLSYFSLGPSSCYDASLSHKDLTLFPGENKTFNLTVTPYCEKKANYTIRVDAISVSNPNIFDNVITNTTVIMPPDLPQLRVIILSFGLGRVKAIVKNIGEVNVNSYIDWNISIKGDGIFNKINYSAKGKIRMPDINWFIFVATPRNSIKHGLGKIHVNLTTSIQRPDGDSAKHSVEASGYIIGRLIII